MAVTGAAERIHPVEDPSAHWSDSLYFNVWDPQSSLFLLTRIAILPNKPGATAGVLAWQNGQPFAGYGHNLDDVPLADWDDMQIGGLRYREVAALRDWEITLENGADRMHLRWDGFSGVVDYGDNVQPLPKPVAWGHYEQTCMVTGSLELNGRSIDVRGVGQRDHSWGYRDWGGLEEWHWITGFLRGDGAGAAGGDAPWRSFNLFQVVQRDGTVTVNGFVHDQGADLLIVEAARTTEENEMRSPQRYELALTVEGGRRFVVTAEAEGMEVPVRPHEGGTIVHERLTRLTSDDGLQGYGIYELLENTTNPPAAAG